MTVKTSAEISLLGADMAEGEHRRVLCPRCGGGSSKERTLSLTMEDGLLLWHCFRASCPESGGGVRTGKPLIRITDKTPPAERRDVGQLNDLSPEWEQWFRTEMLWQGRHFDRARPKLTMGGRVAFPIYGPARERRGYMARSYHGATPKALTFLDAGAPCKLSWYGMEDHTGSASVMLVEDIPSAIRAADYMCTVALNGTSIDVTGMREVAKYGRYLYIALDADATVRAIKLARELRVLFDRVAVLTLTKDIKDMTHDELRLLMRGIT